MLESTVMLIGTSFPYEKMNMTKMENPSRKLFIQYSKTRIERL